MAAYHHLHPQLMGPQISAAGLFQHLGVNYDHLYVYVEKKLWQSVQISFLKLKNQNYNTVHTLQVGSSCISKITVLSTFPKLFYKPHAEFTIAAVKCIFNSYLEFLSCNYTGNQFEIPVIMIK